jgi:hypothetical protein
VPILSLVRCYRLQRRLDEYSQFEVRRKLLLLGIAGTVLMVWIVVISSGKSESTDKDTLTADMLFQKPLEELWCRLPVLLLVEGAFCEIKWPFF